MEYMLGLQKMAPPIPYLLVMYPDLGYSDQSISDRYDKADFSLDLSDLRRRYLILQQMFHPDIVSSKDTLSEPGAGCSLKSVEGSESPLNTSKTLIRLKNQSHIIGEAYFNLRDPVKRAEHWLCMHQTYSKHEGCQSCSLSCEKMSYIRPEFLEELMALHEDIDEGKHDAYSDIVSRKKEIIETLPGIVEARKWERLAAILSKYRYLNALSSRM